MPMMLKRPKPGPCVTHKWTAKDVCPDCNDDHDRTCEAREQYAIHMMAALIPGYTDYATAACHAVEAADALLTALDSVCNQD